MSDARILLRTLLAYHAICLLMVALRLGFFGLGEQPRRSKMGIMGVLSDRCARKSFALQESTCM